MQSSGIVNKALYFATGVGRQSVMVFFVISGYLIGGSVLSGRFSWGNYGAARLSRLWTVLLPCLLLTWIIDRLIGTIDPAVLSGSYTNVWNSGPPSGSFSNSVLTLLGNLLFLQTIAVPVFGSNGPLWSLANEFWYYLLPAHPVFCWLAAGRTQSARYVRDCFSSSADLATCTNVAWLRCLADGNSRASTTRPRRSSV